MKKNKIMVYICAAIFGFIGVYFTFFAGNINNFDSQTKAYRIYPHERQDSDGTTTYQPIYYFKVDGREYECEAKVGSSTYPKESKNTVYYDATDPTKCMTEYERSTGRVAGIICLIATAVIIYFFIIQKPSNETEGFNQPNEMDLERQNQINPEKAEKILGIIDKVQLIYKRIIIGIIIAVLLFLILIETQIIKQTIVSKDYPETVASLVERKDTQDNTVFDDCIYSFTDKNGIVQEIVYTISKDDIAEQELKIKYNENNPQDYYTEGATMDKSGIIWYVVKIVAVVLLVALFFNKKMLNKIGISLGNINNKNKD